MSERPLVTSARTGVVVLATAFILLAGIFNLIDGLAAVAGDQRFEIGELLFGSLTAWGIGWIVLGAIQLAVGVLLFQRKPVGAVLGIAVAIINAAAHLMFVGVYPAWSIAIMVVDGLVIWALTTHPVFGER